MAEAKKEEKKPIMSCASRGHINKTLAIYFGLSISIVGSNGKARFKNVNNCLNTNIYSYLEIPGGQNYCLYLNFDNIFNTSIN